MAKEESNTSVLKAMANDVIQPFADLLHTSRALTGLNISYVIEGLAYFGVVGLLAIYFNSYVGLNDIQAGLMVGFLTAGITLSQLLLGATVDWIGVRKSLLISLSFMLAGRLLLPAAPAIFGVGGGLWSAGHLTAMLGLLGVIIGYGIYQPAAYTAVKKFTNENNAAMGYAMLYALMNLGGFLPGLISPPVRKFCASHSVKSGGSIWAKITPWVNQTESRGISGVFWVYVLLTVLGIITVFFIITKKAERDAIVEAGGEARLKEEEDDELSKMSAKEKFHFYVKNFPLRDKRFLFFIFILIPVQTLFAHNWLTLPQYTSRAFSGFVKDNYEFFVNFNPILIFILTPAVAALTSKRNTYKMMIAGTFVMSVPTFILSAGMILHFIPGSILAAHPGIVAALSPNIYLLFAYLILTTIGEAMWQPRFLQWVAEIAPKNMTGIYMGIGQFPWFLTKVVVSFYSGWFLTKFCPAGGAPSAMHTEVMWFIYGIIAVISPIGLVMARKWMVKGFKLKYDD